MTWKIITASEFEALSEEEKYDLLHKDGVHVGKRICDGQVLILLQLHDFYVEIHYKNYRREIDRLVVSADVVMLQPYLQQIHISELNNRNTDE